MKLITALLAIVLISPVAQAEEPQASPAPTTKENLGPTVKKRLRHVGKNIEKLGDQAGEKLGVKDKTPGEVVEKKKED